MTAGLDVEARVPHASDAPVNHNARLGAIVCVLLLCFAAVVARAWYFQVRIGPELRARAEKMQRGVASEIAYRGRLLDRNGWVLATSVDTQSAYADPRAVLAPAAAAAALGDAVGLDAAKLEKKLKRPTPFVWLKRSLSPEEAARVQRLAIEGVGLKSEPTRYYPNADLAAHVIGFAGADGRGLDGLELVEDAVLAAAEAGRLVRKDARRRLLDPAGGDPDEAPSAATGGSDVVLTIDRGIQHLLEEALDGAVRDAGAKGGMGVVVDPSSGEVLALGSVPDYNPNAFAIASEDVRRNRAIADSFEPGSTLKVFLAAAALESGIDPAARVFCGNGIYRAPGQVIHDHARFGWLTFSQVIQVSSNIGSAKLAERIGSKRLSATLETFGFGAKTGIELPGEAAGLIRPVSRWTVADLRSAAFGQGVGVTAIQLATALSAIANGGVLPRPTLVREIRPPAAAHPEGAEDGIDRAAYRMGGGREGRRVISVATARRLTRMMTTVTREGGTGKLAAVEGFDVAGKTGTAEKIDPTTRRYSEKGRVSSFMGFVPAEDPRLVIVIVVDEPVGETYGGLVAAPAFRKFAQAALSYLQVPSEKVTPAVAVGTRGGGAPRSATVHPAPRLVVVSEEAEGMPDWTGRPMREVAREAARLDLKLRMEGTGIAVTQEPRPGMGVRPGDGCRVKFSPPV